MSKHKKRLSSDTLDALTLEDGSLFHDAKGRPLKLPAATSPLADTHGHLTHFREHDPAWALARAAVAGIGFLVVPLDPTGDATKPQELLARLAHWEHTACTHLDALGVAARGADGGLPIEIRFVAGAHPYGAQRFGEQAKEALQELLNNPRCVGVGEIGLDVGPWSTLTLEEQEEAFRYQIRLAHERALPVQLHLRDEEDGTHTSAHDLALRILDEEGIPEAGCELHCFTSGPQVLAPYVERGCYIAFGGAASFPRSQDIRDAMVECPSELILCETDSPYMAPVPLRGQECEPAMVALTAAFIAREREERVGIAAEKSYQALWENAHRLFGCEHTL